MMHIFECDDCCGVAMSKASLKGELDKADSWTHKKCGQEWRSREVEGCKFWEPHVHIEVLRRGR